MDRFPTARGRSPVSMDTKEEAKYRAEVRARYEEEAAKKKKADRLKQIEEEEKARAAKGPASQQVVDLAKKGLRALFKDE